MINQVTLEGFVVSRWQYKGDEFLRIAHHRPRRKGEIIHSDYVTVRVEPQEQALPELQQGDFVRINGEVRGKDILEPIGRIIQKARLNVELAPELENIIVSRPTAYVLANRINLVDSKEEAYESAARVAGRLVKPLKRKVNIRDERLEQEASVVIDCSAMT